MRYVFAFEFSPWEFLIGASMCDFVSEDGFYCPALRIHLGPVRLMIGGGRQ